MAVATARSDVRRRVERMWRRHHLVGFLFIAPNMLAFMVFIAGPVIAGLLLSLFDWNMLSAPKWVGLQNYAQALLQDPLIWLSLRNTLYYAVLVIPLGIIVSLSLSLALNHQLHGTNLFRALFFIPVISNGIAVALVWKWFYNPDFGVLNALLQFIHLPAQGWINDTTEAMPAIALMSIWQSMGYHMVLFLAGLKGIPRHLYDAAALDGANAWHRFWRITLPLLSPTMFFVVVISIIGAFQVFGQVYVMTQGGPGNATLVYNYYLWENAFQFFKMGYASAMAYLLFLLILLVTLLQMRFVGRRISYEIA